MYRSSPHHAEYISYIDSLKRENWNFITQRDDRAGFIKALELLRKRQYSKLSTLCGNKWRTLFGGNKARARTLREGNIGGSPAGGIPKMPSDYFSDDRIAVYTVIIGTYDTLHEPKCCPDNCDYFLISDTIRPPEHSVWKKLSLPVQIQEEIAAFSDVKKSRFLKMHPQLLFPAYPYSVYLDGNIQLVTDPTEFINRMPEYGLSAHRHVSRDCVYEEAKAILAQKKASEPEIEELVGFLRQQQIPAHYGLLECPVIVCRHDRPECVELLDAWWEMFERFPYRDQMLLPYVLYQRGIRTEEIAWLGDNVRRSPAFRRYPHIDP